MLQQDLPLLDSRPVDGASRWLVPVISIAAGLTGAGVLWAAGAATAALLFLAACAIAIPGVILLRAMPAPRAPELQQLVASPDYSLVGSMMALTRDAAALTDSAGTLLAANGAYRERFDGRRPDKLPADSESAQSLEIARTMAWRDGGGCTSGISTEAGVFALEVERVGARSDLLLWRFLKPSPSDPIAAAAHRLRGKAGDLLAEAGVLAALVDPDGKLVAWNSLFASRTSPGRSLASGVPIRQLVEAGEGGQVRLAAEAEVGSSLRAVNIPLEGAGAEGHSNFYLFDSPDSLPVSSSQHLQAMLDLLPIGLALVDRDGRFLTMNDTFRMAAGIKGSRAVYPGDLVVKEDKAAVADAVRRHARGPAMSGDIAVRLARSPKEPVALTIAGLRGLGDAAVLLLLKDNSEEAKLKRQVAQATKMQAVGQLAGGVAHDFNNILTAIIGHCDLMLMRHTPGDSDYDDIQQIKSNSNRAAGLTRQLLAFSRQQTLRPQVLQLTDVVAEVSHLLKRLLGETVKLVVKHGRNLGPVRADPGQLEQVIINLAVNARDAMAAKGGGTLTIQTYAVQSDQVAELGSDILPIADYSALSVTDTGTGIPPNVLGKIFEPFFTTKEVGKGTGLGLATVYGIVKQHQGWVEVLSAVGRGSTFKVYLPVTDARPAPATPDATTGQVQGGSEVVLLVEDEAALRNLASQVLRRAGYTVHTADSGAQALAVWRQHKEEIDLLLTDMVMPGGMSGRDLAVHLLGEDPSLKVVFVSGYSLDLKEEQLKLQEGVNFLQKPYHPQALVKVVRLNLDGAHHPAVRVPVESI